MEQKQNLLIADQGSCAVPRRAEVGQGHPLTPLQLGMVAGEMSPERWQRDLVQIVCDLHEAVAPGLMQQSLDLMVARHEALRARLQWYGSGDGRQLVGERATLKLEVVNLSELESTDSAARLNALRQDAWTRVIDVLEPPRIWATLVRQDETHHQLVVTYQETVLDEHAGKLLVQETLEAYDALKRRAQPAFAPAVSFQNYLRWLEEQDNGKACQFWSEVLADAPALSQPPMLGVGTCDDDTLFCCGDLNRRLSTDDTCRLRRWAEARGATLNEALLAAWSVVVAHHNGTDDVRFSAVFDERRSTYPAAGTAVAMCFNVLPFAVDGVRKASPSLLLRAVGDYVTAARQHSVLLKDNPDTRRQLGHPSAQTLVFFDEVDVDAFVQRAHADWNHRRFFLYGRNAYALAIRGFGGREMRIQAWYNPSLYGRATVSCLLDQVVQVLERLPVSEAALGCDALLTEEHAERVIGWTAGGEVRYEARNLHELVEQHATLTPAATAVIDDAHSLSYEELDDAANRLARLLREDGLQKGDRVAICMSRSCQTIAAVLGVVKAGGAYVPIERSWPAERAAGAIARLGARLILTDSERRCAALEIAEKLADQTVVVGLDCGDGEAKSSISWRDKRDLTRMSSECADVHVDPDGEAYVIFTSGSTGAPKGVAVSHRAVCNLIDWAGRTYGFNANDRALWVTSLGFDLSVFDIFGILAHGGSVRVVSDDALQCPERLYDLLTNEKITFWNSAPQTLDRLRRMLRRDEGSGGGELRLAFLSGDWIPLDLPSLVRERFPSAKVVSLGGATEATVWSNHHLVDEVDANWRSIPYGRPIQNAHYHILDQAMRPQPIGVAGELYIGGDVLALGYAGDEAQTRERFVDDGAGGKLYRTGDAVRWWPDGSIELLGRLDEQVKVRGYRVELGEVEQTLLRHPAISQAVATVRRNGVDEQQLVAYLVAGQPIDLPEIRRHLRRVLPDYMIPGAFVLLDAMPLTSSGKLDRQALPVPEASPILRERQYVEPQTSTERKLADVFREVLRVKEVGRDDNFFDLGGDSLSSLGVLFSAERCGLAFTVDLLRTATVAELALHRRNPQVTASGSRFACSDGPIPLTPGQHWLVNRKLQQPAAYSFATWLNCTDLLDERALDSAWRAVVSHHEALRIQFQQGKRGVTQYVAEGGEACASVAVIDLRAAEHDTLEQRLHDEVLRFCHQLPMFGVPLPRLALVHLPNERRHLFMLIPHIITDEYSARIVIDDLGTAYQAVRAGGAVDLPATTLSFATWARRLQGWAESSEIDRELASFVSLPWRDVTLLPRERRVGDNRYASARDIRRSLDAEQTAAVLQVARSEGLSVESVLLAALGGVLQTWAGGDNLLIDLTGNGREALDGTSPPHRTTGYFTSLYPVLLHDVQAELTSATARSVQRQMAAMPGRGIRYGLMRYLRDEETRQRLKCLPQAQIKLNYHGLQPLCMDDCAFQPAALAVPPLLRETDRRRYELNLEVAVRAGCLVMAWKYSDALHRRSTIESIATNMVTSLVAWSSGTGRSTVASFDRQHATRQVAESDSVSPLLPRGAE